MEDREDAGTNRILGHSNRACRRERDAYPARGQRRNDETAKPEHKPVNYILVESVDEYSEKIKTLGGKIVVPKMEVPGFAGGL